MTPPTSAAQEPWSDGYWFALRNLNDEAVQADLKSLEATRVATPDASYPSVENAAGGLSTGSAPHPAKESGATS